MPRLVRHPKSGALYACNAGAWTGAYNSPAALPVPEWTVAPSFTAPIASKVGTILTLDFGTVEPVGAVVEATIGTSAIAAPGDTADDFTGPFLVSGQAIPAEWVGKQPVARFVAINGGQRTTLYVPSGVIVEANVVEFPPNLAPGDWSAQEVRTGSTSGRRRVTLGASVSVPLGFEARWYSGGVSGGVGNDGVTTAIAPGQTFTTNGQMPIGSTCYNAFFWKRLSDGAYQRAHPLGEQIVFTILGLSFPTDPGEPPANQVVSGQAALIAALNARKTSGSSADWIIDLQTGNYNYVAFTDMVLPGKTTIRSQDRANLGAKFTGGKLINVENLYFEYVDINRTGLGFATNVFEVYSARKFGFSYSRIYAPEITRDALGIGYIERGRYGIRIDRTDAYGKSTDILIRENLFDAPFGEQLYLNGVQRAIVENNVSANACGDFLMCGTVQDSDFLRNWSSRLNWPSWDPNARNGAGDFYHSDMLQMWSPGELSYNNRYIGNVHIIARHPTLSALTRQGILLQGLVKGFFFKDDLIVTNCFQGIWVQHNSQGGHRLENCTLLRIIDVWSEQPGTYYRFDDSPDTVWIRNIQHKQGTGWTGARNIPIVGSDYTGSRAYYTNPVAEIAPGVMSSFYDHRPVAGTLAHWGYSGGPAEGAAERFREVIVDKRFPNKGPAAAAWKQWYDPRGQIAA